jgi:hypothetical protein
MRGEGSPSPAGSVDSRAAEVGGCWCAGGMRMTPPGPARASKPLAQPRRRNRRWPRAVRCGRAVVAVGSPRGRVGCPLRAAGGGRGRSPGEPRGDGIRQSPGMRGVVIVRLAPYGRIRPCAARISRVIILAFVCRKPGTRPAPVMALMCPCERQQWFNPEPALDLSLLMGELCLCCDGSR